MDAPEHELEGEDRAAIGERVESCLWMFRTMTKGRDLDRRHIEQGRDALLSVCDQAYDAGFKRAVEEARRGGT